jgi:phage terminase large subunit-like protein
MDGKPYRLIFPATKLASGRDDESKTTRFFQVVGQRGYYVSAGVGGAIAGKTADIGIIDDPTKNRDDAESQTHRKSVWDFFTSVFYNRQFGNTGRLIIVTTRWHEDDLAGRLIALMKNGGEPWEVLSFPAVAEWPMHPEDPRAVGDALWPAVYPSDELARRRRMSEYDWAALYQQRPAPVEGGLIKRAWWRYYDPSVKPTVTQIVISLDPATKAKQTNDPWALGVWGAAGPAIFGLDAESGHWDTPACIEKLLAKVVWCKARWPSVMPVVLVENAAAGPEVVSELRRKVPGVLSQDVKGDKVQRAHAILPAIESGMVYLPGRCLPDGRYDTAAPWPTHSPISTAWVDGFLEECVSFPFGSHDDQVDQMTQALKRLYAPKVGAATANIPGL